MAKVRRKYDKDFKRKVVAMSFGDKSLSELSEELGIHMNLISRWRKQFTDLGEASFPGHGNAPLTEEQKEIHRLRKELQILEEEHTILKKAIRIFSRSDGKNMGL